MSQPDADPSPAADEDSLPGGGQVVGSPGGGQVVGSPGGGQMMDYQEDGFGDPEEPTTVQDDEPASPDDFTPPTSGSSESEDS